VRAFLEDAQAEIVSKGVVASPVGV